MDICMHGECRAQIILTEFEISLAGKNQMAPRGIQSERNLPNAEYRFPLFFYNLWLECAAHNISSIKKIAGPSGLEAYVITSFFLN